MKSEDSERRSSERTSSDQNRLKFPDFPFQLLEQNYLDRIEFIKSNLHEYSSTEDASVQDEDSAERDFNSSLASLQNWFMRISHKAKLDFVLKLLEIFSVVLKRNTNSLVDILGPIPKDFIYAKTQFTFSKYDMTPLDTNRCLTIIPLAEARTNSISWFSELEEKEQVRVMIILLNLSGSAIMYHFYFKAVKYLDPSDKYDPSVIQDRLKDYKFFSLMNNKSMSEWSREEMSSDVSLFTHETKNLDVQPSVLGSSRSTMPSKNDQAILDYEKKIQEWEKDFNELITLSGIMEKRSFQNRNVLPVIDMLQLLPISVNRYIYSLLDSKSKKHLRVINRYWYKSSASINKEEHSRQWLDEIIDVWDYKLYKYKGRDWYSELRFVNQKMNENPPEIDTKKKSKRSSVQPDEIKRSRSAPSLTSIDEDAFKPKYNLKMIPAPNHEYPDKYPKNPYKGKFIISEIFNGFDHTRCIAANFQWIAMSDKANISLHSMLTGAPNPCQLIGHTGYVTVLCFHPSKSCLFSGSCDTTIKYWDIFSRTIIATFTNHKSLITDMSVSENYLASVSMDQSLRVFKIDSGSMIWKYLFSCYPLVVALGKKLDVYVGAEDGTVLKTDLDSSTTPEEWENTYAHGEKITCILFDEPFVITGGGDGFVRVWHFEHFDASAIATLDHNGLHITAVALSFMKVLTTAIDGVLRIWDIYNSKLKRQILVNIARTPILSMICMEIYDHTKIIINSENSLKVIEFSFHWIHFNRLCSLKDDKEPRFVRGLKRITTTKPADILEFKPQFKMIPKQRFEKRCRDRLRTRHAALSSIVTPSKDDRVTFKEMSMFSEALLGGDLFLFPRIIPGTSEVKTYTPKDDIMDSGNNVPSALWKYLPRSTKAILPGFNPSKKTM